MTDFIQKKVDEAVIVITNRLEIIDTNGNGWDDIQDFLRQALIEQHNRTVEECAKVLPKKMRLDSDRNTRLITIGHNSVIAECRMNILNLKK